MRQRAGFYVMTIVEVDIVIGASHANHSRIMHWTVANLSYRWFCFVGRRLATFYHLSRKAVTW
jgi:hypothetical protein